MAWTAVAQAPHEGSQGPRTVLIDTCELRRASAPFPFGSSALHEATANFMRTTIRRLDEQSEEAFVSPVHTRNGHGVRHGPTLPQPRTTHSPPVVESLLGVRLTSPTSHIAVISLDGEIDLSTVPRLRSFLRQSVPRSIGLLVVDLSEVVFCDTAGLEVLDDCAVQSATRGTAFRVVYQPNGPVERLLALTGWRVGFAHYPSMDEACGGD